MSATRPSGRTPYPIPVPGAIADAIAERPVDRHGRHLPPSDWPTERSAPAGLEPVRRFCNTANLESGADLLGDAAGFDTWLQGQGLRPVGASAVELAGLIAARESLRAAAAAHRGARPDGVALAEFERHVAGVRFVIGAGDDGFALEVDADPGTIEHFLGTHALAVVAARAAGTWERLTACRHCGWVVFDRSKNRSGQWCSMSACGGRDKVRRHRDRHRDAHRDLHRER